MTTKKIFIETLLTENQKSEILQAVNQMDIVQLCRHIPEVEDVREAHKKFFCKHAYEKGVKYFSVLPTDYQDAVLDRVVRKYSLMDLYFRYTEDFFLNCVVKFFSRVRFERKKFVQEMFVFMSDESTVCLLKKAEMLTEDSKVLKRMEKVINSYSLQFNPDEEE